MRNYDWNGHKDMLISAPQLTDEEVAAKVRMLLRSDLDHEPVVCAACDRIMCLSKEKAAMQCALEEIAATEGLQSIYDLKEIAEEALKK